MDFIANSNIDEIKPLANSNIKFNIASVSLYRFWARANIREFLWAKTRLDNEPFYFLGTGDELFKGFTIALFAIFIPLWLIPQLIYLTGNLTLFATITAISYLIISFVSGFGIWRARAYLLSRTSYRGITFSLGKGALKFAIIFMLHSLILVITIGWWHPKMRQSIAKRIWSSTFWGKLKFQYLPQPNTQSLGGAFAVGWIGTAILGSLLTFILTFAFGISEANKNDHSPLIYTIYSYSILAGFWLVAILCFGSYRAEVLRKITSAIYIDGARLNLNLSGRPFFKVTFKNAILMLVSFGLYAPYAAFNFWKMIIENLEFEPPPAGLMQIFQSNIIIEGTAEGIDDAFELPFFDMSPL